MRHLAVLVLLASPLAAQQAPSQTRERVLERSVQASEAVRSQGVLHGLPAQLSHDAVLVWPGAAVLQGTIAITRFFDAQHSITGANISWQLLHLEMARDSSLALAWGVAVVDRDSSTSASATHRIGRVLMAWKPVAGDWKISALAFSGLLNGGETMWTDSLAARESPLLPSTGPAAKFIAADSSFAALAERSGAQHAFTTFAAPDAVTFSGSGELAIGRAAIGAGFAGDDNHWSWGAVAAGASSDGLLGWTVGQAVIAGKNGLSKSKYLTLWRRQSDGSIRFISDGGNGRP
ncbi:MAG: hypothetical protein ABJC19_09940 [Gemmatimonadota bacterium]